MRSGVYRVFDVVGIVDEDVLDIIYMSDEQLQLLEKFTPKEWDGLTECERCKTRKPVADFPILYHTKKWGWKPTFKICAACRKYAKKIRPKGFNAMPMNVQTDV